MIGRSWSWRKLRTVAGEGACFSSFCSLSQQLLSISWLSMPSLDVALLTFDCSLILRASLLTELSFMLPALINSYILYLNAKQFPVEWPGTPP